MLILIGIVLVVSLIGYFVLPYYGVSLGPQLGIQIKPAGAPDNEFDCFGEDGCGGGGPPGGGGGGGGGQDICYAVSETGDARCSDGADNDGDGFCDGNGHNVCTDGSSVGDSDCCPDDFDPCTEAAIIDNVGTCGQLQIPDCRYCQTEKDCFDGDLNTQDFCVSGRCHWEFLV